MNDPSAKQTPRVLSEKLKMLEHQGLVQRMVMGSRPPGVRYSLTQSGLILARLGEPVFLYLDIRSRVQGKIQEPKSVPRREGPIRASDIRDKVGAELRISLVHAPRLRTYADDVY